MLAYVLQVKVEMELEIQQCEKTKAVREEQLERLTQICQEQAVSIDITDIWLASPYSTSLIAKTLNLTLYSGWISQYMSTKLACKIIGKHKYIYRPILCLKF